MSRLTAELDRTNWKWGKTPINILMLSIAYRGISFPLFWAVLDLEGNSCNADRINLLRRLVERFGLEKIDVLLADREFFGNEWFSFLTEQKIPFAIRAKQNCVVETEGGTRIRLGCLRKMLCQKKVYNYPIQLWGFDLYASIKRRKGAKEQMIVVSNMQLSDPFGMYRRRWEIETMFGCLKTRGFRLEDTHITDPDKIEKVLFVLAIALCWAYRIGDVQDKTKPIEIKAHGRRARSLFREGLNLIRRAIFSRWSQREFRRLLSCFITLQPGVVSYEIIFFSVQR
ncbi:MAG: IS4 family transposase [Chlamydiales bacterium]|nr:IS4 family transposase [Chlamydiales bacterium]